MQDDSYIYITKYSDGRATRLEFPYNMGFIDELKALVPHKKRIYNSDPSNRFWAVSPEYNDTIIDLAKDNFDRCFLIEGAIVIDLHTGEATERG
jgi:hypothetical protein